MSLGFTRVRSRMSALCAVAGVLALVLSGCGGDAAAEDAAGAGGSAAYAEPEYAGPPADLTSEEVCALLDREDVAATLEAEVISMRAGSTQPDCTWTYKLPGGPATTLQVQVMSTAQTGDRLGAEALEWALDRAPEGSEVTEVAALRVPNGSYEFGVSTVVFAVDPVGRLFTVATHSDTSEESRTALVEATLAALTERHG